MQTKAAISEFEQQLITIVSRATVIPGTAAKRFIRDLRCGHIKRLSERGRWYLAFIAHRYRRQYQNSLTAEQMAWITERLNKDGLWGIPIHRPRMLAARQQQLFG